MAAERCFDHMAPDQSGRDVGVVADAPVRHYAARRRTARVATASSPPTAGDGRGDEYGARMHRTARRETEPAATEPACAISRETPGSATRGRADEPRRGLGAATPLMSCQLPSSANVRLTTSRPLSARDVSSPLGPSRARLVSRAARVHACTRPRARAHAFRRSTCVRSLVAPPVVRVLFFAESARRE